MSAASREKIVRITEDLVARVSKKLAAGGRVRQALPDAGLLWVERPLPFLLVYRRPVQDPDSGTGELVVSEAAYLTASSRARQQVGLAGLADAVVASGSAAFGAFLLIEVWAAPEGGKRGSGPSNLERPPSFRVLHPRRQEPGSVLDSFEEYLARIKLRRLSAEVETAAVGRCAPRRLPELISHERAQELGCIVLGLEVLPVYRSADGQEDFPFVLRTVRRLVSRALRRTIYQFAVTRTTHRPEHFHVLGRRALVKSVWEVDGRLAHVADSYDFLLQVTPANTGSSWAEFHRSRHEREPTWHYRHLPSDPPELKRLLYRTPIERVEDPALALLFRQKQQEIDREITMLGDRNTPRFLPGSQALYGPIEEGTVEIAREILSSIPARARDGSTAKRLDAKAFAARARREIEFYRAQWNAVIPVVEIRDDIASGLMVSRGRLFVGADTSVPESRVEALLQHEIGTHVLTYYNGSAQPFQLLRAGLAGYEALQEGLAVLAEYLVGGLSRPRLRLLAGRVVAARGLVDGATFIDTWRGLTLEHGFEHRTAFTTALRIHRGGGLTKDALYLKGLLQVLDYFARGGSFEPLLLGKMAVEHVPIIRELKWRGVLKDPPLSPRYLELPGGAARIERLREGMTALDLLDRRTR